MRPILDHGSNQSSVDALGARINTLKAQAHDVTGVLALNQVAEKLAKNTATDKKSQLLLTTYLQGDYEMPTPKPSNSSARQSLRCSIE